MPDNDEAERVARIFSAKANEAFFGTYAIPRAPDDLTIESLYLAMRELGPVPPAIRFITSALAETQDRLFPASKNRSARIRKKLIKRFGGEFRREPAAFQIGDTIYAHPTFESAIRALEDKA